MWSSARRPAARLPGGRRRAGGARPHRRRCPSARERYARVLELDPDDLDARRAYGELLSEAGLLDGGPGRARPRWSRATPDDLRARRALALVLASRHAGAELAAELAEVVRLDPEDLDARLELGAALTQRRARSTPPSPPMKRCCAGARSTPAVLKLAGRSLSDQGRSAPRPPRYYERLHRMLPDDPRPVFLLGAPTTRPGGSTPPSACSPRGRASRACWATPTRTWAPSPSGAARSRRRSGSSRAPRTGAPGKAGVRYNYALALRAAGALPGRARRARRRGQGRPQRRRDPLHERRGRAAHGPTGRGRRPSFRRRCASIRRTRTPATTWRCSNRCAPRRRARTRSPSRAEGAAQLTDGRRS